MHSVSSASTCRWRHGPRKKASPTRKCASAGRRRGRRTYGGEGRAMRAPTSCAMSRSPSSCRRSIISGGSIWCMLDHLRQVHRPARLRSARSAERVQGRSLQSFRSDEPELARSGHRATDARRDPGDATAATAGATARDAGAQNQSDDRRGRDGAGDGGGRYLGAPRYRSGNGMGGGAGRCKRRRAMPNDPPVGARSAATNDVSVRLEASNRALPRARPRSDGTSTSVSRGSKRCRRRTLTDPLLKLPQRVSTSRPARRVGALSILPLLDGGAAMLACFCSASAGAGAGAGVVFDASGFVTFAFVGVAGVRLRPRGGRLTAGDRLRLRRSSDRGRLLSVGLIVGGSGARSVDATWLDAALPFEPNRLAKKPRPELPPPDGAVVATAVGGSEICGGKRPGRNGGTCR